SWTTRIAWEPLLRLTARSLSARAAWLRVDGEIRIVTLGGNLPQYTEAWLTSISRRATHEDFVEESSGGFHAYASSLGQDIGAHPGSVGVMMIAAIQSAETEIREVLTDLMAAAGRELELWLEANRADEAVHTLSILARAVENMQLGIIITD